MVFKKGRDKTLREFGLLETCYVCNVEISRDHLWKITEELPALKSTLKFTPKLNTQTQQFSTSKSKKTRKQLLEEYEKDYLSRFEADPKTKPQKTIFSGIPVGYYICRNCKKERFHAIELLRLENRRKSNLRDFRNWFQYRTIEDDFDSRWRTTDEEFDQLIQDLEMTSSSSSFEEFTVFEHMITASLFLEFSRREHAKQYAHEWRERKERSQRENQQKEEEWKQQKEEEWKQQKEEEDEAENREELDLCYDVLDLDPNVSFEEVSKRHKKLALQFHPDKNMEKQEQAERRMKLINNAYEKIKKKKKNRKKQ